MNEKHPHVRGEDAKKNGGFNPKKETPPRAWGRLFYGRRYVMRSGNTPTCVGKTPTPTARPSSSGKHPHVRGEDSHVGTILAAYLETPPRAWGRLSIWLANAYIDRNTPTCVGKTMSQQRYLRYAGKHPHVRGEDLNECTS